MPDSRLRPLAIFLLKPEIASHREAVRDPDSLSWFDLRGSTGARGAVAIRRTRTKSPWWTAFLEPHVDATDALNSLSNASTSALLFLEASDRRFAISFGYGRHLLEPEAYEQDFGLKVVLNTVDPDSLTSVDARTFDELTIHTRRDVSRGSSFGAFGLDVTRDLVRAVTGPPRDESLGRRASGSDALALISRAQVPDLPALCGRLLLAYGADDYKERFPWIDHLRRVRDPVDIASLNADLVEALRARDLTDIHLAPPEPMEWERLAGFAFSTSQSDGELDTDPRISGFLDSLPSLGDLSIDDLKKHRVVAIGADTDQPIGQWSVYRCIVFETRRDDSLYALSSGQWYSISASFAEDVERFARELPELQVQLPNARMGVTEADYNRDAALVINALCVDRQLVPAPGGDRVELCDLLTEDRQFLHVKKRGSSSTLSHLFSQGLVSAELLAREPAFRTAARNAIAAVDERFQQALPNDRPVPGVWEVSYVVITRGQRDTPLTLPFFSLVNLRSAALRLQDLGYRVSVRQVDEV